VRVAAVAALMAAAACAGRKPAHAPAADPALARAGLLRTVGILASPDMEGRLPGTEGYDRAARYVADRFAAAGLEPGGDDGYFQRLTVESNRIERCDLSVENASERSRGYRLGEDYACRVLTGSASLAAPVVFAGWGFSLPERGYDDYSGTDVRGKIVLVFKGAPSWKIDGADWAGADLPRATARAAADHGALGLFLVSAPKPAPAQKPIGSLLDGRGERDDRFPVLHVGIAVAEDLLAGTGRTLEDLESEIETAKRPDSLPLRATARLDVRAEYRSEAPAMNVVGALRGERTGAAEEFVVVGAHLDHVGSQAGRVLYPGANDNASGSAAVAALAEALARGPRLERTVVFVLFSSEEHSLDGARKYAASPPFPLDRTVAMVNLDCVGFGDAVQAGGGKDAPALWKLARENARALGVAMTDETWGGGGADATPFREAGIPTLYFAATHAYDHLHLPSDRPETLSGALLESETRVAYRTLLELASGRYSRESLPPLPSAPSH
jgi:hypothetical protein